MIRDLPDPPSRQSGISCSDRAKDLLLPLTARSSIELLGEHPYPIDNVVKSNKHGGIE
ncbi:MAG: hypothetical protein LDL26_01040 [Caenispirillum bisanense]|nr:hypothetical protein [Caenispirillum bisanense]MCA1971726.1 hypothetical protein [Caenispirillum sp.]